MQFDLIVIGAGAGGIMAAREAQKRGVKVALVTDGPPGGECTFTGCVPSKALLDAAAKRSSFELAMQSVRRAISVISAEEDVSALLDEGISMIEGRARFVAEREIEVEGKTFKAKHLIIATGSRPFIPGIPGLDGITLLTNENIFDLDELPTSMAILGAGPVGVELAQAFARLGSRITLIERLDRVLPGNEPEVHQVLLEALTKDGVDVRVGAELKQVSQLGGRIHLDLGDETLEVDQLLVAVGRRPNTVDLNLDQAGVATDELGYITVDDAQRTSTTGVLAVGDCCNRRGTTHLAGHQAYNAVANATSGFRKRFPIKMNSDLVPAVVFADPEVASVGITEVQATRGEVALVRNDLIDRAIISDRTDGFAKLIAEPRRFLGMRFGGRVVGATVVSPRAAETLQEVVTVMQTGAFTGRIAQSMHPYPSWGQALQMAARELSDPLEAEVDAR